MESTACKNFQSDGQVNYCVRVRKRARGILAREDFVISEGEEKKYCLGNYQNCPRFNRQRLTQFSP